MKRRIFLSVLLAALILLSANAWAAITIVGHFTGGGGTTFDIGTFKNDKVPREAPSSAFRTRFPSRSAA